MDQMEDLFDDMADMMADMEMKMVADKEVHKMMNDQGRQGQVEAAPLGTGPGHRQRRQANIAAT